MKPATPWEENKRQLHAHMREYTTELSEIARLFQRVNLSGSAADRTELKQILVETKSRIVELLDRMERGSSS